VRRCDLSVTAALDEQDSDVQAMLDGWMTSNQMIRNWNSIEIFLGPFVGRSMLKSIYNGFDTLRDVHVCLPYFHWCGSVQYYY
jgi:hypothetical protein